MFPGKSTFALDLRSHEKMHSLIKNKIANMKKPM